jgi:hypothetical protein
MTYLLRKILITIINNMSLLDLTMETEKEKVNLFYLNNNFIGVDK